MDEIATQVHRVSSLITKISEVSAGQSASITTVCNAVTHLDESTQQNSALVEESAAASESLAQQAQYLVDAVSAFKVVEQIPPVDLNVEPTVGLEALQAPPRRERLLRRLMH